MALGGDGRDSSDNSLEDKPAEARERFLVRVWKALNHQVLGGLVVVVIVTVAGVLYAMVGDDNPGDGPIRFTGLQAGAEIPQVLKPLCVSGSGPREGTRWWAMAKTPAGLFPAQQAFEADGDRYTTTELHIGSSDEAGEGFAVSVYEVSASAASIKRITDSWELTANSQPTPWVPGPSDIQVLSVDVVRIASADHRFAC